MAKFHSPRLAANGRFRVEIGGRNFWCGTDQQTAIKLVNALDVAWDNEKYKGVDGKKCWSNESINTAYQQVGVPSPVKATASQPLQHIAKVQTVAVSKLNPAIHSEEITLHQAIDVYCKMRVGLLDVRTAGTDSFNMMQSIKKHLPNQPLHSIGAPEQKVITDIIKARPIRSTGEPISIITARKWLQDLGAAFAYFAHPDSRIGWVPPYPVWREKFFISNKQAENIATRAGEDDFAKVKPTYTIEQLTPIWKQATKRGRLYLLGGICLGWTAMEFATLKANQVRIDGKGEMFIDKKRSKTGVPMSFWVCPELAHYLNIAMNETPKDATRNPQRLALMTMNNGEHNPLVRPCKNPKHHRDSVSDLWTDTVKRVNRRTQQIPRYPHSHLRKMAGQLIENITGNHSLSQMLLSHKQGDVASTNYIGNNVEVGAGKKPLERLWDAQREVHKALLPVLTSDTREIAKRKEAGLIAA